MQLLSPEDDLLLSISTKYATNHANSDHKKMHRILKNHTRILRTKIQEYTAP